MLKVIKRDCSEVEFDKSKIEKAILKAMRYGSGRIDEEVARNVSEQIEWAYKAQDYEEISIYDIEKAVHSFLCSYGHEDTARAYEGYRAVREFQRLENTSDNSIETLISGDNKESLSSNSNKKSALISTQRDLISEEVSKDISLRKYLTPKIAQAHRDGIIYIHDLGHFITKSHNCMLVNLIDMLWNGTVINGKMIERPKSLRTACTVATQIIAQVASGQHGGQTISLSHLAPFVRISYNKIKKRTIKKWDSLKLSYNDEILEKSVLEDLQQEIEDGIQTLNYQINTLQTSNGQAPFLTVFMYISENEEYRKETAMLIEEMLKQRYEGLKNEVGVLISPAFPKLIYALDEDNVHKDSEYKYITDLAKKCVAKRMMPDFISAKIIKQNYEGNVIPPMGCRSFLSPWKDENGNYKIWGRPNMGVCSINLADVGLSADGDMDRFWNILDERLQLCYEAQMIRYERLSTLTSDSSPIHWQYGAIARLPKHASIKPLLQNGYSTISLGYIGLYECVMALIGESHTTKDGEKLAIQIMRYIRSVCDQWKYKTGLGWGLYGTPSESLTERFAKACRERHGVIKGITDKDYLTNSYHVNVTEEIDAFSKLKFESQFHSISSGGAISYVEVPNLNNNLEVIEELIQFIYENVQYAELNTKSDYCMECGFDGEMLIDENMDWYCPNCGNRDKDKMTVVRRTCGK